jgi:iron complex outermembrane receptor protein
MISYEGGFKYGGSKVTGHIAGFYQSGKGMIDWLWSYADNRYTPVNLFKYKAWGITSGYSMSFAHYPSFSKWLSSVSVNYMLLNINKSIPDSVSKYYNLHHKFSMVIRESFAKRIHLSWNISYQDRYGEVIGYSAIEKTYYSHPYKPFWLVDGAVRWNFRFVEVFAEISNMLNTRYIDAGSAIQPGRWLKAGLVVKL